MDDVRVRAPGKVNLALLVGCVDDDGYHELGTVFCAVSIFDDVVAAPAKDFSLNITGLGANWLPTDETNLALRAAHLLAREYGVNQGVHLKVRKRIPVAGGMAGGSADAAGALLACSVLWDLDVNLDDLLELGRQLGADVPFALMGGVAIGRGRGDELVPLLTRGRLSWVFASSHRGLSTPQVFRRFDELCTPGKTELPEALLAALAKGDLPTVGSQLVNDLTAPACDLDPALAGVLAAGLEAGALGAVISGSGPTCAFLVGSDAAAVALANQLDVLPDVRATLRAYGPVPGARLVE